MEPVAALERRFGGPAVAVYGRWVLMARPKALSLGSLVVAGRGGETAFSALPDAAFAEYATVIRDVEAALGAAVAPARVNYVMLMLVEPWVHFHAFPRYAGERAGGGLSLPDLCWPDPPVLAAARDLAPEALVPYARWLAGHWPDAVRAR